MLNSILILLTLILFTACASTTKKVNDGSYEVSSGISALENAASTVDRAIATEKRIRERFDR